MRREKQILNEVRSRFHQIVEYISANDSLSEAGEDPNAMGGGADPMAGGADPMAGGDPSMGGADPMGGGDPNAMGGDPMAGGADPMAGGDPNAMGGDPSMGGGDPNAMGGGAGGAEGFDPQGPDATLGAGETQNLGGDPNMPEEEDEEVIDVDDLTNAQEETKDKVDQLLDRFESIDDKLYGALDKVMSKLNDRVDSLEAKMDERLPNPEQKMSLRAEKSAPFQQSVENYWQTQAPDNYSPEDDNDGADMPEYSITKRDIDDANDLNSIYKSFDDEDELYGHMSLKDIFDL